MRSFANLLIVVALGATAVPALGAEPPSPRALYTDALLRERSLRQEIESQRADAPSRALLQRMP